MATHFDKIADGYHTIQTDLNNEVYVRLGKLLNPMVAGRIVLDIGNGGYFPYDTDLPASITAVDVSTEMLNRIKDPKVRKVVGDARTLTSIQDSSADVVLLLFCIHHVTGRNEKEAIQSMEQIIAAARSKLKDGGQLIIAEATLNKAFYLIERAICGFLHRFMKLFDRDLVFFHQDDNIRSALTRIFRKDASAVSVTRIRLKEPIDPIAGAFPGLFKIPPWMIYSRHILFEVSK